MNLWHDIHPARMKVDDFMAVIEIEKGSKNKYEMDKETGALRLDRILYTSTHYPANYGFIPRTYADDNDPLDVLVLCSEAIRPLSLVRVYPIGYFAMRDGASMDEKILAVPFGDPVYNSYHDVSELPDHIAQEISHFFNVYKNLEDGKNVVIDGVYGQAAPFVRQYYDLLRAALESSPDTHFGLYALPEKPYITPEVCRRAEELFDRAELAAEDEVIRERVRVARLPVRFFALYTQDPATPGRDEAIEAFRRELESRCLLDIMEGRTLDYAIDEMKRGPQKRA